jgi:Ca-activated chloride channel family protein
LHYNAGAAAYQSKKFDEAIKSFQAAVASPDPKMQEQSYYNLANSEFRLGESDPNAQQKMALWEQAVEHYDTALKMNQQDQDARFNKELVQRKLEELKKQQQQQQQQNKDKKENNKDEKKDQKEQQKNNEQQDKEKKDEQKKQDQNNSQEQKQDKDQKQQQEQQQKEEEKKQQEQASNQQEKEKEKSEKGKPKPGDQKEGDKGENADEAQAAQYAQLGKMTPAQAKQLLDAQKSEEKAMIFLPPQKKTSSQNRSFKDW